MNRKWFASALIVFLSLNTGSAVAADWKTQIRSKLGRFGAQVGLSVRSFEGVELLQVNGSTGLHPASTAKMISSACALEELGQTYTFKTIYGLTTPIERGVIKGDLVIRGSGDPSFVIEDLRQDIDIIQNVFGLKEIQGQLIFDVSYLGAEKVVLNDDFAGDDGRSFAVELSAIPFNHNSFSIWVFPQGNTIKAQHFPVEALDPKLTNRVQPTAGSSQSVSVDYNRTAQTIRLEGQMGRESKPRVIYRALEDPFESFARVFRRLWIEMGGKMKDTFLVSTKAISARELWLRESQPISRLFLDINKLSTNFGSELIGLAAGAKRFGQPASIEKSRRLLAECVKDFGLTNQQIDLENASGLSRKSKVSPTAFTHFLVKTRHRDFFPEFLSSLSVLGQDGTTRSRLTEHSGRARLKTGSIKGVRSIAGYVDPNAAGPLAFVLIFNQPKASDAELKKVEDEIIQILLERKT